MLRELMRGLSLCLLAASVPAEAQWQEIAKNGGATIYIDPSTIKKIQGNRSVKYLTDLEFAIGGMMSTVAEIEFSCKTGQWRFLRNSSFSEKQGTGKEFGKMTTPTAWGTIPTEGRTPMRIAFKRVCTVR
jgi:hypothetical protein